MAQDIYTEFVHEAVWHGPLERAEAIRAAHPELARRDIVTAAILGDDAAVRDFVAADPGCATAKAAPLDWDPLTYLCFSKYLRLDRSRTEAFVRAATALLEAGASANTGFFDASHQPQPEWESAIYGAAGVAHNAEVTKLLLQYGADPNDEETPYHTPETYDNAALQVLLESGKLTQDSLVTMLLRKADWHDYHGMKLLLDRGVDPNHITRWRHSAFGQALRRDNHIAIIELLLDHGADPRLHDGMGFAIAARRGRRDVLELFERRGLAFELTGDDRLLAECARGIVPTHAPASATALAEFSGNGNDDGVRVLLDLGTPVDALYAGDGYWDIAKDSTALHVAAWRAQHSTVKLLIERGASVNAMDGKGRTPLMLAVKACVNSYWTDRRSPESVDALLRAGASREGVPAPCGYEEVDRLLRA